jgi:hypothetical protein
MILFFVEYGVGETDPLPGHLFVDVADAGHAKIVQLAVEGFLEDL